MDEQKIGFKRSIGKTIVGLKHLVAHILILSILSFQFSELLIFLSFKINQDYIATNLCIEKDIEGSTCKGCCQLKKKLEEQEQKKEALPPVQSGKIDITFNTPEQNPRINYYPGQSLLPIYGVEEYTFSFLSRIFHPPRIE